MAALLLKRTTASLEGPRLFDTQRTEPKRSSEPCSPKPSFAMRTYRLFLIDVLSPNQIPTATARSHSRGKSVAESSSATGSRRCGGEGSRMRRSGWVSNQKTSLLRCGRPIQRIAFTEGARQTVCETKCVLGIARHVPRSIRNSLWYTL